MLWPTNAPEPLTEAQVSRGSLRPLQFHKYLIGGLVLQHVIVWIRNCWDYDIKHTLSTSAADKGVTDVEDGD